MIRAVVLDVDGVIVGTKSGVNFPNPSDRVSNVLKQLNESGIAVSFLSAKTAFAVANNIKSAGIDSIHISDGGAVLYNPIQNKIFHELTVAPSDIRTLLASLTPEVYIHLFSANGCYVEEKHFSNPFTQVYTKVVARTPTAVKSFSQVVDTEHITKINVYAFSDRERKQLDSTIKKLNIQISFSWASNPSLPGYVCVITAKGVSKRSGVEALAGQLGIGLHEILAVGDTAHDWDFISVCGYKGIMGNATEELKAKANFDEEHTFLGGHVDEDGILDILKHFKLI